MNNFIREAHRKVAYISGQLYGNSRLCLDDGDIELGLLYKEFSDKLSKVLDEMIEKEFEHNPK